jgi:hypothetical protein
VFICSDGCAGHFWSQFMAFFCTLIAHEMQSHIHWFRMCPNHGKWLYDPEGGVCTQGLERAEKCGKDVSAAAKARVHLAGELSTPTGKMHRILSRNFFDKVLPYHIKSSFRPQNKLNLTRIKNISSYHSFVAYPSMHVGGQTFNITFAPFGCASCCADRYANCTHQTLLGLQHLNLKREGSQSAVSDSDEDADDDNLPAHVVPAAAGGGAGVQQARNMQVVPAAPGGGAGGQQARNMPVVPAAPGGGAGVQQARKSAAAAAASAAAAAAAAAAAREEDERGDESKRMEVEEKHTEKCMRCHDKECMKWRILTDAQALKFGYGENQIAFYCTLLSDTDCEKQCPYCKKKKICACSCMDCGHKRNPCASYKNGDACKAGNTCSECVCACVGCNRSNSECLCAYAKNKRGFVVKQNQYKKKKIGL